MVCLSSIHKVNAVLFLTASLSQFTLHSGTSGIAPVRSGKCVYTEGVVSAQRDLKPESLHISPICSHFDQHVQGNQSHVPNGFDLIVRLRLHQERDVSRSIQLDGVCRPRFGAVQVRYSSRLHYEITRTELNRFNTEH